MEQQADDATLVQRARASREAGGGAPFRALYERHADEVYGFLVRLLRDAELAEDVLQESFFRAWKSLDALEGRAFRPWLYGIVRNAAVDALRARKKEERLAEEKARLLARTRADEPGLEPEKLQTALDALPDESRALLVQRHFLGTPLGELAASLAVTERTVRNRLQEAATLLAAALLATRGAS